MPTPLIYVKTIPISEPSGQFTIYLQVVFIKGTKVFLLDKTDKSASNHTDPCTNYQSSGIEK